MKLTQGRLKICVLIHIWLCWKESQSGEPVKVHFRYEALDSQEQRVDRFWDGPLSPSSWPALVARPFWCLQFACTVHMFPPWRQTHFPETMRQFWSRILLTSRAWPPRKCRRAHHIRYMHPISKGTSPPSSCGTLRPGLPRIVILAVCRYSIPWSTTWVGWAVLPESGTIGRSQTGKTSPMAPRHWWCGTALTSTSPQPSTLLAPPL